MIRVVTDTMSDLPQTVVDRYNISLIPAYVTFSGGTIRDRFDMSPTEFYKRLVSAADLPVTNQPSVRDFESLYRRLLTDTPDATILSIQHFGRRILFITFGPLMGYIMDIYSLQYAMLLTAAFGGTTILVTLFMMRRIWERIPT